jgi:hypothetical protein
MFPVEHEKAAMSCVSRGTSFLFKVDKVLLALDGVFSLPEA